jgi:hypothetical protein
MSQSIRQENLFAAEDFTKIYQSFKNVDFRAYDFDSIKQSMIDYISAHYPEDFNDYIESSEFIAIIELLSYLGTSLAFRVDLNSRENFMDTAQRKESIIRLARMLNYQPKRNIAGEGLFKIVTVQTTEPLTDSLGRDISNTPIAWDDPNNSDSYEQFIAIVNATLSSINPFGKPYKAGSVNNINTHLYQMNSIPGIEVAYPVSVYVNGVSLPMEVVNPDFTDGENFFEREPDPNNAMFLIYRNDGQGLSSNNTGFFFYFKQGDLINIDNSFDFPIASRVLSIPNKNINENDVWVQEINNAGIVQASWTKVDNTNGNENIIFNSISKNVRKIYSVITKTGDAIDIEFPDGNFGEIPTGLFRTWVRTSAGTSYVLRPEDAQNLEVIIPYYGADNLQYVMTFSCSLQESINNSSPSETNEEIKVRAPQVYYTQNRMVNNEDYNVFPLSQGNSIAKIKTINRTHAGHSRYIDINDPTGFHQNLLLLAEDGALYKDGRVPTITSYLNNNPGEEYSIASSDLTAFLKGTQLSNFFYSDYLNEYKRLKSSEYDLNSSTYNQFNVYEFLGSYTWSPQPDAAKNNTGNILSASGAKFNYLAQPGTQVGNHPVSNAPIYDKDFGYFRFFEPGAMVKFVNPASSSDFQWAVVDSVTQHTGTLVDGVMFTFSVEIPKGWRVHDIMPAFRKEFTDAELTNISSEMIKRNNFGIAYDVELDLWSLVSTPSNDYFNLSTPENSWLVDATFDPTEVAYTFVSRGSRYVFESLQEVRFFFDTNQENFDVQTLESDVDEIEILDSNASPNYTETWIQSGGYWVNASNMSISYSVGTGIFLADRSISNSNATASIYTVIGTSGAPLPIHNGFISATDIGAVSATDKIIVKYTDNATPLGSKAILNLFNPVFEEDGYLDPSKVEVIPADTNKDGIPDEPELFNRLVSQDDIIFLINYIDSDNNKTRLLWQSKWSDFRIDPFTGLTYSDLLSNELFLIKDGTQVAFLNAVNSLISTHLTQTAEAAIIATKIVYIEKREPISDEIIVNNMTNFSPINIMSIDSAEINKIINLQPGAPVSLVTDSEHFVRNGRSFTLNTNVETEPFTFKWRHYAPIDNRIDPSISNIMDMIVLTDAYYNGVLSWKNSNLPITEFPPKPTTQELSVAYDTFNDYKMLSDEIVFNSASFRVLFGRSAAPELQARFKVIKTTTTTFSDNEIKSKVISAIDSFFGIDNWDFGETFYFTELAAYIHKQLTGVISSVVLVPTYGTSQFGNLFQVKSEPNEIFISTATVSDIDIVSNLTNTNMRL